MALSKSTRRILKDVYKNRRQLSNGLIVDDKEQSLTESLRFKRRYRYEDEGWKEYGFIWFNDSETDEDVQEWFDDNMVIRIYSDYDCTGRPFTFTLDWHRNPNGLVSFIHHVLIDC